VQGASARSCPYSPEARDSFTPSDPIAIRDLRTKFPRLKELVARDGEVIVTDRGVPAFVLCVYRPERARPASVDYFDRLKARQPRPLSAAAAKALDEADRAER
jgi:antitoxin (DNA-binding transcriptional repressor) of toxin-antitoxin stability system